jgi:hypothetical protein
LEVLATQDSRIFNGHSVNFLAFWYILWHFWYILWHFGIFCGDLVYFPRFGILYHEKSGNPVQAIREII